MHRIGRTRGKGGARRPEDEGEVVRKRICMRMLKGECVEDVQRAGTVVMIQGDDGQSSEVTKDAMSEWVECNMVANTGGRRWGFMEWALVNGVV